MNDHRQEQMSLFPAAGMALDCAGRADSVSAGRVPAGRVRADQVQARTVMINPHLLAARRIARKMRRLPDRSEAETRAGLAICARLKAYLAEAEEAASRDQTPRH